MQCRSLACPAVRCGTAVRCCAVLCHAAQCFLSNIMQQYQVSCDTPVPTVYVRVYSSFFRFLHLIFPLSVLFLFPRKLHPCWRSERDIANKHTQHSTGQLALRVKKVLALSNRQMHQNHEPLLSAAFTFSCILPCACVAEPSYDLQDIHDKLMRSFQSRQILTPS